jgi:TolA-binding protein
MEFIVLMIIPRKLMQTVHKQLITGRIMTDGGGDMIRGAAVYIASAVLMCAWAPNASAQDKTPGSGKGSVVSDAAGEASGPAETTGQHVNRKKEMYQKKAEDKLHRMDQKIRGLVAEAEKEGEKTRKKAVEKARVMEGKLKEKSEVARKKLNDLKAAGSQKWEGFKKELDAMIGDLEREYHNAVSKIKSDEKNND